MLKITRLEIDNFGRHTKIEHDLQGHVVGLTGPNGKGKSTVLQAIQFALTGAIDHEDSLPAFIRKEDGPSAPKKARVKMEFEADGKRGTITRTITPTTNSRELTWEGYENGKPVSADKKVAEILFQILGVDKKAINSTVFVKQGEIGNMFGKDTERRDFYIRLMMFGHLAKIADVVDVYRKQVGDSLQDLSAVRDAADAAAEEATAFFEEASNAMFEMHDVTLDIAEASELLALFSEQTEAEYAVAALGTGSPVTPNAEELKNMAEDTVARIGALRSEVMRKSNEHLAISKELEADTSVQIMSTKLALLTTQRETTQLKIAAGNPTQRIQACNTTITARQMESTIPARIVIAEEALSSASLNLTSAENAYNIIAEARQAMLGEFTAINNDLKTGRAIYASVQGGCDTAGCPVCGSASPDRGFLDRSIAQLELSLIEVTARGEAAKPEFAATKASVDMCGRLETLAKNELAQYKTERVQVMASLIGAPTLSDALSELDRLEVQLVEFNVANADNARLEKESIDLVWKLAGRTEMTQERVAELELRLGEVTAVPWDSTLDTQEYEAKSLASKLGLEIRAETEFVAKEAAARARQSRVYAALENKLETISKSSTRLCVRLSQLGALTHTEVTETVAALRQQQGEYNRQQGIVSAARTAQVSANSKVIEIKTRMAEQADRRKLVDDLVRLRDTFKPAGVATEYLDYKFGQVSRLASEYLAESHADFMVCASNDTPLAYDFLRLDRAGEVWMPQSRMSGGQKVRLAVATLRAIHALIMPNVGLMVLDEPTTHLDDEAVKSMAEMLRGIGDEGSLQMIVCDHNPVLIDAFSDIIELK